MAQLIGNNLISTAVFISGRGTNLKSLIKFSKKLVKKYVDVSFYIWLYFMNKL